MEFLSRATRRVAVRGFDYFINNHVRECEEIRPDVYKAKVLGSNLQLYDVEVDLNHPLKSVCNCPHAGGKRILCKHKIAVYFLKRPREAFQFYYDVARYAKFDYEDHRDEILDNTYTYIENMSKEDLIESCYDLLLSTPDFAFYDFLDKHNINYIFDEEDDEEEEEEFW